MSYEDFVSKKLTRQPPTGLADVPTLHGGLFPFQRDLVTWALRRGRSAIFADTGLGKSRMQLEWARYAGKRVMVLAPLAVAQQTAREGRAIGVDVNVCREDSDVRDGVNVTNYDRIHKFDPSRFDAVVLDESSIIKHHTAKTLKQLLDAFSQTPFRLCATATPSPNDYTELGTHSEFLGICTRTEMLAEYFCHDGGETQTWRLKGHARGAFWKWVAQWAALVRTPRDLGYDAAGYDLPALHVEQHILDADPETVKAAGLLFAAPASSLTERRDARRASLDRRVSECVARVNASDEPWVVWCDLNAESDALAEGIRGAVEVRGSQTTEEKEALLADFSEGRARVIVSKPSICGFGLNWQHAANMAFVGVTDSYEAYYQAVRRIWRFGQTRECRVHVYASEIEGNVIANLARKQRDAETMAEELSAETRDAMLAEVRGGSERQTNAYETRHIRIPSWIQSNPEAP
jgi:superfamily II DNA or RNA helicase